MEYIIKRDRNGNGIGTVPPRVSGTVVGIKRHGHTIYGNPIISIRVDGIDFAGQPFDRWVRISDNASLVYAIENPEYRDVPHTFALTRAGRISHVIRA